MLRTALIALPVASPAFAQDSTVNPLAAAGCGANEIHFDVKTDKKQHPTAQPDAGKALVYVLALPGPTTLPSTLERRRHDSESMAPGLERTATGLTFSFRWNPAITVCVQMFKRSSSGQSSLPRRRPASRPKLARPTTSEQRRRRDKNRG